MLVLCSANGAADTQPERQGLQTAPRPGHSSIYAAFIKDTEGHAPTKEEVLQRLQEQQLTSSNEGLALWAHLNKLYPHGLRECAVSAVNTGLS